MTEQKAIEKLNMLDEALNFQRHDADECSLALHMAIEALERQMHKKPKIVKADMQGMKQIFKKNMRTEFLFGDIVVVDNDQIGVIVKSWEDNRGFYYEVYVRSYNCIKDYREEEIERYRVRHKFLSEEEMEWQNGY